ncbi:MAG: TIGR03905 family TSCPD domain-containing protein [Eubacterium sp.]|nr:TIGR03905 family TSCPD domain-containing protein [Eubacterium sp.]
MSYRYKTHGTCSSFIDVDMDGNKIKEIKFTGGCDGNLKAISALAKGMSFEELRDKVQGLTCGFKNTSCADQLVRAIEEAMANAQNNLQK